MQEKTLRWAPWTHFPGQIFIIFMRSWRKIKQNIGSCPLCQAVRGEPQSEKSWIRNWKLTDINGTLYIQHCRSWILTDFTSRRNPTSDLVQWQKISGDFYFQGSANRWIFYLDTNFQSCCRYQANSFKLRRKKNISFTNCHDLTIWLIEIAWFICPLSLKFLNMVAKI